MIDNVFKGGCFCGAVRIRAEGEPLGVPCCHCKDCRRWSGAPVSVFAGYRVERVEIVMGTPQAYESSPGVKRSFCGECGSALFYEDGQLPGETYIAIGVFDKPEQFEPDSHSWSSQSLGWLGLRDELPRHERSSRPR